MKVIFIKDLKGQGKVNDIKEVSTGYAMNYLIKNGYAVKWTKTGNDILNKSIIKKNEEISKNVAIANSQKEKLEKLNLQFIVKSGKDGKVFGSVSSKQICDELNKLGYSVDKKNIKIDNQLSVLGMHVVLVELYKGVIASVKVNLVSK